MNASRGEALRPPPCAPHPLFLQVAPVRLWTDCVAGVILRLGSFPVTLRGGRSFPVTLRGGRRCALPPAPPTRFYRLVPVRLWTCYLAGVILRLGSFPVTDPACVNASRGEKLSGDPACVNASRGEGAAPSLLQPPTNFFRLAPARLWTCYLAGVILRLGSFPVTRLV